MSVLAPPAPGRIGAPVEPTAMLGYLEALAEWLGGRRRELDDLDAAVLRSPDRDAMTSDVLLAMALWQAVQDRYELLLVTWDSGRVGPAERERLTALVWGRLDATLDPAVLARAGSVPVTPAAGGTGSGLAVSLPEACRLSDALAGQLRTRLALDPAQDQTRARLGELRAGLERLRDQAALEPSERRPDAQRRVDALAARAEQLGEKAGRGGDVAGLLARLEHEVATTERDLIVAAATAREARDLGQQASELRDDLDQRGEALNGLVRQCLAQITPAPKYAVPDVDALGPPPRTTAELEAYLARLDQVSRAMQVVQHAYSAALAEHTELVGRLDAYRAKAEATGAAAHPAVRSVETAASTVLAERPSPVAVARTLLDGYRGVVEWAARPADATRRPGSTPHPIRQEVS